MDEDISELTFPHFSQLCALQFKEFERLCVEDRKHRDKMESEIESLKNGGKLLWQSVGELRNKLLKMDLEKKQLFNNNKIMEIDKSDLEKQIEKYKNMLTEITVETRVLEQDRNDKKEIAKKEYQALITAMSYHKQYFKCYIDVEAMNSLLFSFHFFCDFREKRTRSNSEYYVLLNRSNKGWKVVEIKPSVTCEEIIIKHLHETGDIQGFLAHVRKLFQIHQEKGRA